MEEQVYKDLFPEEWYEVNPKIEDDMEKLLTEPKKRRATVPRGYLQEDGGQLCWPVPGLLKGYITLLVDYRTYGRRTLREIQDLIYALELEHGIEDPLIISLGGITQLFDRIEKSLNVLQKERTNDRLKRLRQEKHQRAKDRGEKRPFNFSAKVKEKVELQKKLTQHNRQIEKLKKEKVKEQKKAARMAAKLKLKGDPTKYKESEEDPNVLVDTSKIIVPEAPKIITPKEGLVDLYLQGLKNGDDERSLLELYKEINHNRESYDQKVIAFLPTPRQYMFLSAPERVVLYGGQVGGGKSYSMVVDAMRYAHIKQHRGVIIRKTTPELEQLIETSHELYKLAFPSAKFNSTEGIWTFPSGAKIRFAFLDKPVDKYKFQGRDYSYVGFDELAQQNTDEGFTYLFSRNRISDADRVGIRPYVRATANPGAMWVYELFIKDKEPEVPFLFPGSTKEEPITAKFIPARLADNPHLDEDNSYRALLNVMNETEKKQLLEGDWLASDTNMFPEFSMEAHVVDPYPVPKYWNRVAGIDYGYRDPSAVVWFAVDPDSGKLVVYKEFLEAGLTGRELALAIRGEEQEELVEVHHPIDWQVFARTGHSGPTIAESMLSVPGFRLARADKNRTAGWTQIHEYLRPDPNTGYPRIEIFNTCPQLIKQMRAAQVHKRNPDDLDDTRNRDGHWDLLDALRYGVMSRPRVQTFEQRAHLYKQQNRWNQVNSYFSS